MAGSEWIVGFQAVEPVWDGMAVLPAVGELPVVGVVVDAITRFMTHGSYATTRRSDHRRCAAHGRPLKAGRAVWEWVPAQRRQRISTHVSGITLPTFGAPAGWTIADSQR